MKKPSTRNVYRLLPVLAALLALLTLTACPMNNLPRNMRLTAFDPYCPNFTYKHEADAVPAVTADAEHLFQQGMAATSYDLWPDDRDYKLASLTGIESSSAGSTHIASDAHTALTSGGHTSISAKQSLLARVKEAIRLFAYNTGIRLFAYGGDIDIKALKQSINVIAKLNITHIVRHKTADRSA